MGSLFLEILFLTWYFYQLTNCAVIVNQPIRNKRLSIVDWANYDNREQEGPGTYAFGYDIEDVDTNNVQFRSEERHSNGTVIGSYGYVEPDGNVHIVHYTADLAGYRAIVENSRRGLLKPIIIDDSPEAVKNAGFSSTMLQALKSQQIYKNQKVHDQHLRPKDEKKEPEKNKRKNSHPWGQLEQEQYEENNNLQNNVNSPNFVIILDNYKNPPHQNQVDDKLSEIFNHRNEFYKPFYIHRI